MAEDIFIVAARRTPIGAFQGALAGATAPQLGSAALRAAVGDSRVSGEQIDEVILGCVLPAGLGRRRPPGLHRRRPAARRSGHHHQQGLRLGHEERDARLRCDPCRVSAHRGGRRLESMTNAPYLLPKARQGYRMGHGEILDHMFYDGLQNPYDGQMMGSLRGRHGEQIPVHARRSG